MPVLAIISGLSGVGKTWLLQRAMKTVPGQLLSASRLIEQELNRVYPEPVEHDDLRKLDIAANQEALVAGFVRTVDPDVDIVVLDAHVAIDTPRGLEFVPKEVFARLTPSLLIFIEDHPEAILRHRSQDRARNRPFRDVEALALQQSQALAAARQVAKDLMVPFYTIQAGDVEGLTVLLMKQNEGGHG
jgi:adenylate kinase